MKIHLTVNDSKMEGFYWASPKNEEFKTPEGFYNCWNFCMESQCTNFYAPSILDSFTCSEIEKLLPRYANLVAPKGKITLGGTDLYILAKESINRSQDLGTINNILFNKGYTIRSLTSIESTRKFLQTLDFVVTKIDFDYSNFNYTVEGIKNG